MSRCLPYLAQELIDSIIDTLRVDSQALSSCSLVSHAWSARSSLHLCQRLRYKFSSAQSAGALIDLLRRSTRLHLYVQELVLECTDADTTSDTIILNELRLVLRTIPSLRVLEIEGLQIKSPSLRLGSTTPDPEPRLPVKLRRLRISRVVEPDWLTNVLMLFESIDELEIEGVRTTLRRPSKPECQISIPFISFISSDPGALLVVLSQVQMPLASPHLVQLSLNEKIFTHTQAAMEFNVVLREAGQSLKSIHFDIAPRSYSVAVQDIALRSLDACQNLQSITVHMRLGSTDEAQLPVQNAIGFAFLSDILRGACHCAPSTLTSIWITISIDNSCDITTVTTIYHLGLLRCHLLQDAFLAFARKRVAISPEEGIFFDMTGSQTGIWIRDNLKGMIETTFPSEAISVLRFV